MTTALETSGLSSEWLELEITETSLIEGRADVFNCLEALTSIGVKLVMDDYGSGYSSMTNLRRYPFHKVKIDRRYVAALDHDPVAEVIIDCALALAKSLGLTVVIEGVETETQRARLVDKAPDQLQGFLFGRPEVMGTQVPLLKGGQRETSAPRPVFTSRNHDPLRLSSRRGSSPYAAD